MTFRFIRPPKQVGNKWEWDHLQVHMEKRGARDYYSLRAKERILPGLLIPYVGDVQLTYNKHEDLDYMMRELYVGDLEPQPGLRKSRVPLKAYVFAEPTRQICHNEYCVAAFINEATDGTDQSYNCDTVNLSANNVKYAPNYAGFMKLSGYILVNSTVEKGEELFLNYGEDYARRGYTEKRDFEYTPTLRSLQQQESSYFFMEGGYGPEGAPPPPPPSELSDETRAKFDISEAGTIPTPSANAPLNYPWPLGGRLDAKRYQKTYYPLGNIVTDASKTPTKGDLIYSKFSSKTFDGIVVTDDSLAYYPKDGDLRDLRDKNNNFEYMTESQRKQLLSEDARVRTVR